MERKKLLAVISLSLMLMISSQITAQSTFDTALTYEGFLMSKNSPVDRAMDLRFTLFADPNAVQQVGVPLEGLGVDVEDGHFTLDLDFGETPFNGEPRWLLTEVRQGGTADPYVSQLPPLKLMLSPYAIYARRAGSAYALDAPDNSPTEAVSVDNDGNVAIGAQTPGAKLSVDGPIAIKSGGLQFPDGSVQTTAVSSPNSFPSGGIIMWSGAIADIPAGWVLCDGNNGAPDLRNRFIVGAVQDDVGTAKTTVKGSLMVTGGEDAHRLTVSEMPSHSHSALRTEKKVGDAGASSYDKYKCQDGGQTVSAGGNQLHENCPPFYALAFIMKE